MEIKYNSKSYSTSCLTGLVLIHGANGAGKTTLLKCIEWVLSRTGIPPLKKCRVDFQFGTKKFWREGNSYDDQVPPLYMYHRIDGSCLRDKDDYLDELAQTTMIPECLQRLKTAEKDAEKKVAVCLEFVKQTSSAEPRGEFCPEAERRYKDCKAKLQQLTKYRAQQKTKKKIEEMNTLSNKLIGAEQRKADAELWDLFVKRDSIVLKMPPQNREKFDEWQSNKRKLAANSDDRGRPKVAKQSCPQCATDLLVDGLGNIVKYEGQDYCFVAKPPTENVLALVAAVTLPCPMFDKEEYEKSESKSKLDKKIGTRQRPLVRPDVDADIAARLRFDELKRENLVMDNMETIEEFDYDTVFKEQELWEKRWRLHQDHEQYLKEQASAQEKMDMYMSTQTCLDNLRKIISVIEQVRKSHLDNTVKELQNSINSFLDGVALEVELVIERNILTYKVNGRQKHQCSTGEREMIEAAITCSIAMYKRVSLLLIDEGVAHLDNEYKQKVLDMYHNFAYKNLLILLVSHSVEHFDFDDQINVVA